MSGYLDFLRAKEHAETDEQHWAREDAENEARHAAKKKYETYIKAIRNPTNFKKDVNLDLADLVDDSALTNAGDSEPFESKEYWDIAYATALECVADWKTYYPGNVK